jgi:hypothetical protein
MKYIQESIQKPLVRCSIALIAAAVGFASFASLSRAAGMEIIPSVGLQKAVKGSDEVKPYYGLALRAKILPALKAEIGAAYRTDDFSSATGDFTVKSWPLTASLWLSPIPALYAGGGVGWYNQSFEFPAGSGLENHTRQDFGMHVGGGLELPVAPSVGLDLNGRYVFLPVKDDPVDVLKDWDPSFWTTSLGLAIHF